MESYEEISYFVAVNQKSEYNFWTGSYRQMSVFWVFFSSFYVCIMESILMLWVGISPRYVFLLTYHNLL
jgi:hypothetical protein